jgi:hypothetical protein
MAQGATAMMTRVFTSKKDAWLVSLIWGSAILPLVAGLLIVWTDARAGSYLITISAITFTLILAVSFPLYYELTEHELVIRSGLFRWRVPLDGIEEIRPTRSILSAPALSIDRLLIRFRSRKGGFGLAMISPRDRAGFLREVAARTHGMMFVGDRLVRTGSG